MYFDDSTRDEDRSWSDGIRTRVTSWGGREPPLVLLSCRPHPFHGWGFATGRGFHILLLPYLHSWFEISNKAGLDDAEGGSIP